MCVGWLRDHCGAGVVMGELAVDELRSVSADALFCVTVSGLGLEASSFMLDLYANFEKS